jgi:hypothetical protein
LLLTYDGQKKFWTHPVTRKHLNFTDMVTYLNEKARALEIDRQHTIRLAVFGLDLTDPVLAPGASLSAQKEVLQQSSRLQGDRARERVEGPRFRGQFERGTQGGGEGVS